MPISIGIPFYNAELFLLDAIKSVFAQTYTDWELILMDDGSTDRSLEIAHSINDPRVSVYSDGENKKLAARLNEIVGLAKYDLIARMDADDLMSPTRLEKQIEILNDNPEIDLVTTGLFSVTDDLKPIGVRWHHATSITLDELLNKKGCGVVHAAILGRKDWFVRNGYNEKLKLAQDYELWIKSKYKNDFNIYLIQEALYYYRETGSINASKVLIAYKYERELYKQYAANHRLRLILKSHVKTIVVYILNSLNQFQVLIKRRSTALIDYSLLNQFSIEVKQILSTKIKTYE